MSASYLEIWSAPRVVISVDLPDKGATTFNGKVVFVSPEINPVNGQARVWAEIDNSSGASEAWLATADEDRNAWTERREMTTELRNTYSGPAAHAARPHLQRAANRLAGSLGREGSGFVAVPLRSRRRNLPILELARRREQPPGYLPRVRRRVSAAADYACSSAIILCQSLREWVDHCRVAWSGQHPARESREAATARAPANLDELAGDSPAALRPRRAAHVAGTKGHVVVFRARIYLCAPCLRCLRLDFVAYHSTEFRRSTARG